MAYLPRLFLLALLLGGLARGDNTERHYVVHGWQQKDGLPQNSANEIIQGENGYLWVATYGGIVRFDGNRFAAMDSGNTPAFGGGNGICALAESRNGGWWAADETGNVARYDGREVRLAGAFSGRAFDRIAEDDTGDLWMVDRDRTLVRLRDRLELPLDRTRMRVWTMSQLVADKASKKIWVLRHGRLEQIEKGSVHPLPSEPADPVFCIGPGRHGDLWLVFERRIERWEGDRAVETIATPPWPTGTNLTATIELTGGDIAIGTSENGLFLFGRDGKPQHFDEASGLTDNWVKSLANDREGTLWVGLGNGGINALHRATFETVAPPDAWQGRSPTSVFRDHRGTIWVGTEGAGLYSFDGTTWQQVGIHAKNENRYVWSIAEDSEQRLWVGTWGGGVCVRDRDGTEFHQVPQVAGPNEIAPVFQPARSGGMWIAAEKGLFREMADGSLSQVAPNSGLHAPLRVVREDTDGSLWVGTLGQGLGHWKEGHWNFLSTNQGLPSDHVLSLCLDADNSIWIGTPAAGLQRIRDGQVRPVGALNGLRVSNVRDIVDDGLGYFWLCTRDGIARVSKRALNDCADGLVTSVDCRIFGTWDGLNSNESSGCGLVDSDGALWFPTRRGLVRAQREGVLTNQVPPPIVLEQLTADGDDIAAAPGAPRVVSPGHRRFVFRFAALTFIAPELAHFKYQLLGVDRDWIDGGSNRSATYSFLPPGTYRFRVAAANSHGIWNPTPAEITVTLLPYFWQTWWFKATAYLLIGSLLVLIVVAISRHRWKRRLDALERQQALERERSRIAKDIHDDLGASLTRISLMTQTAHKELVDNPGEAARELDRIYGTARELTRAMDEIVWAVNPCHDSLDSIANYIAAYSQEFLSTAGIACRWNFPMDLSSWPVPAERRHNLFLAFKEALNNIVKHAHASRVMISIETADNRFVLTVADNGLGLKPDDNPGKTGGNGLGNMRHRLQEIGGSCEIASEPGHGTRVVFSVPAEPASPQGSSHPTIPLPPEKK